jgi:hypothetical protein
LTCDVSADTEDATLLFMDQNQLNNLRNIAQGLHYLEANRIARETAAATSGLLRSQEQQRALEQQRLAAEQQRLAAEQQRIAVEQQRLQEDKRITKLLEKEQRRRTEFAEKEQQRKKQLAINEANAIKTRADSVQSIRIQMAAIEEEIGEFRNSLSKNTANPPLNKQGAVETYRFLLLQKKLEKIVVQKCDLHELSDIRFIGQLEKSVRDMTEAFPHFCGDPPVKRAYQYLRDLAVWPSRSVRHEEREINPWRLIQEVRKASEELLKTFENAETEIASSAVIARLSSEITVHEQLLMDAEAALEHEWPSVGLLIKDLQSVGVGPDEVRDLTGGSFPRLSDQIDLISRLRQGLKACRSGLEEVSNCWAKDNTAVKQVWNFLADVRLPDAQQALEALQGRTWTDIDLLGVQKEFDNSKLLELNRLIAEVDRQADIDALEAVRQVESRAAQFAQIDLIFSELLLKRNELLLVLDTRLKAEIARIAERDRRKAVLHGEALFKRAEGIPEIEALLFERVETLRSAVKASVIRRKKMFVIGTELVCLTLGVVAGLSTFLPELRILENFAGDDVTAVLQSVHAIPILGGLFVLTGFCLVPRISALNRMCLDTLLASQKAVQQFQLDATKRGKSLKSHPSTISFGGENSSKLSVLILTVSGKRILSWRVS